ncbi:MAG: hypothetical protein DMF50_06885 [Acidobacteria bacterium]|nr:MAG: hypothetical protein DMF50_06885 [Acidobacteriota bacterium]
MIGRAFRVATLLPVLLVLEAPASAHVEVPRAGDRSIQDRAGVIAPDDAALMERRHRELFDKTGVALVIVTVPRLEGEPIEDFAVRVGQQWGVGRKAEDRGVVVALAIEERRVFIATGYGVEGFLPDGRVGSILDQEVVPSLRRDDFSTALTRASTALTAAAAREYGVTIEGLDQGRGGPGDGSASRPGPLATALLVIVAIVVLVTVVRHPWLLWFFLSGPGRRGRGVSYGGFGGGFGGNSGFGGFGGGGFGGGGAGRGF